MTDLSLYKSVHFIGIGGVSMSSLAHIMLNNGAKVSGSDRTESETTKRLAAAGADIYIGQSAENIKNPELVVYTAAISKDNPELVRAREKGIETVERADFLGKLMELYDYPVSVSGTHGKTTTTSMLSCVFLKAALDPTVLVGGEFAQIGGNYHIGSKKHMIFEGCEYVDSFLKFKPKAAVILNIEADHLDYFSGIDGIKASFNKFMKLVPPSGFVVINADDKNVMDSLDGVLCEKITFGKNGKYHAENVTYDEKGCGKFDVYRGGEKAGEIALSVPGAHNVSNALAVFACAEKFGIDEKTIEEGISGFGGAKRRFEYKGSLNGARIFDDYAHHPTEVKATLETAKKVTGGEIWCVFQPHTYSRTKALLDDFAAALEIADHSVITEIYAAREKNTIGISGKALADKIKNAVYIADFKDIADYLKKNVRKGDTVLTVGAGTITQLSELL